MVGPKGASSTPSYKQVMASRGKKPLESIRGPSGEGKKSMDEEQNFIKSREDNRTKESEE